MAERPNPVEHHYTSHDLGEVILNALRGMGKDVRAADARRSGAG